MDGGGKACGRKDRYHNLRGDPIFTQPSQKKQKKKKTKKKKKKKKQQKTKKPKTKKKQPIY